MVWPPVGFILYYIKNLMLIRYLTLALVYMKLGFPPPKKKAAQTTPMHAVVINLVHTDRNCLTVWQKARDYGKITCFGVPWSLYSRHKGNTHTMLYYISHSWGLHTMCAMKPWCAIDLGTNTSDVFPFYLYKHNYRLNEHLRKNIYILIWSWVICLYSSWQKYNNTWQKQCCIYVTVTH